MLARAPLLLTALALCAASDRVEPPMGPGRRARLASRAHQQRQRRTEVALATGGGGGGGAPTPEPFRRRSMKATSKPKAAGSARTWQTLAREAGAESWSWSSWSSFTPEEAEAVVELTQEFGDFHQQNDAGATLTNGTGIGEGIPTEEQYKARYGEHDRLYASVFSAGP